MKPLGKKLLLEIEEVKIGALQTDTITERAKVIAWGRECKQEWGGAVVYFKAWAVDVITHNGKKYYFIDEDSTALCATE